MEDKKIFYKSKLQRDNTILRTAANTLKDLAYRFPSKSGVMEELGTQLIEISERLLSEGWKGYIPKPIAEVAIDNTLELINTTEGVMTESEFEAEEVRVKKEAEEAKKLEELAEKKRVAAEKKDVMAKAIEEQKIKDLEKIAEDQRLLKEKAEKVRKLQTQLEELEV